MAIAMKIEDHQNTYPGQALREWTCVPLCRSLHVACTSWCWFGRSCIPTQIGRSVHAAHPSRSYIRLTRSNEENSSVLAKTIVTLRVGLEDWIWWDQWKEKKGRESFSYPRLGPRKLLVVYREDVGHPAAVAAFLKMQRCRGAWER